MTSQAVATLVEALRRAPDKCPAQVNAVPSAVTMAICRVGRNGIRWVTDDEIECVAVNASDPVSRHRGYVLNAVQRSICLNEPCCTGIRVDCCYLAGVPRCEESLYASTCAKVQDPICVIPDGHRSQQVRWQRHP